MRGFGLQYLDGLGNSYDEPDIGYNDYENEEKGGAYSNPTDVYDDPKEKTYDETMVINSSSNSNTSNMDEYNSNSECCECNCTSNGFELPSFVKNHGFTCGLLFGIIAGKLLEKLFREDK